MASEVCCVCGRPGIHRLGNRPFCDQHHATAIRENRGFVRSGLINVGLIVLFTVVVGGIAALVPLNLSPAALVAVGIALAIVPAALWLGFFYAQDRLEPEPHNYVLGVFLLAMLVSDQVRRHLLLGIFEVNDWLALDSVSALVGYVFVVGIALEAVKYAVVRFTVYPTTEFDERMDGIVYGTAAGLGVATMLNINFIIDSGGASIGSGVIQVVVTSLAHGAFGGLMGYFLGEAKFVSEPVWWVPAGVALSAVADGLFSFFLAEVNQAGVNVSPWRGLLFALLVAVATFAILLALIRRAIAQTLNPSTDPAAHGGN